MENQKHRFAGSGTRAEASSRGAAHDHNHGSGSLGGDYARDAHPGGLGDDYARDGGFSGGGNHEDYARESDSVSPMNAHPSTSSSHSESGSRRLRGVSDVAEFDSSARERSLTSHPDDLLAVRVWQCIASAGEIKSSRIQVSVVAGAVILAGTVPSNEQKQRVEAIAYRCEGVRTVQNALWVAG